MKKLLTIFLLLFLMGCATSTKLTEATEFTMEEGYIGMYGMKKFQLTFQNLDTRELYYVKLKNKEGLAAYSMPVGSYVLKGIKYDASTFFRSLEFIIEVPLFMKTIIEIRENSIIFLGNFIADKKFSLFGPNYDFTVDYTYEEAFQHVETEFYYGDDFKIYPLEQMSLENIQESHFDFNM